MSNRINVLFGRVAVDLRLVAKDDVEPLLLQHRDTPEPEFVKALLHASLLSEHDSAQVRAVVAQLLEQHEGDATRALAVLEGNAESADGAAEAHEMRTIAGPPAAWRLLSESVQLGVDDSATRYVDPVEHDRGGMGRILIVRDERMNRTIAMKELIPPAQSGDKTMVGGASDQATSHQVQRFLREARITGSLEHPSIVPVYELGRRDDGTHYYTMKLVRGRTLFQAIYEAKSLKDRLKLLPHVIDLCQAIAYAHDKGIVHRDIKPSNVMVGAFGETVVIDWGLARVLNQEDPFAVDLEARTADQLEALPGNPTASIAGTPVGTPHYMAPEQAEGRMEDVDTRSDVYSLGVVLYEVITGKTPYTGNNNGLILAKVRQSSPPSVLAREAGISPALAAICTRAMARNPALRYASAGELANDLARFTTGALVQGYEYTMGELIRHYYRRNRALCNMACSALLVTILVAVTSYVYILEANHREREQRIAAVAARSQAEESAYRANIQLASNYIEGQLFDQATTLLLEQPAARRNLEWGLLFEQCNQDYTTATDQNTGVSVVRIAPGNRLLTYGDQDQLVIRACPDLTPIQRIDFGGVAIADMAVSKDGTWLALIRSDGLLQLYNFNNYQEAWEFRSENAAFDTAVFSGDETTLAAGASDGTLYFWNCRSGQLINRIAAHDAACQVFGLNQDGSTALSSDRSGRTVLWDVATGQLLREFIGYGPSLNRSRDRFALRSGRAIHVYDIHAEPQLFESEELIGNIGMPMLDPAGAHVVSLIDDGVLRIWDVASRTPLATVQDKTMSRILSFSHDGTLLALSATPNAIQIRRTDDGSLVHTMVGHSNWIRSGVFDETGRMFYSCANDSGIKAWQLPDIPRRRVNPALHRITDFALSLSGNMIGVGSSGGLTYFADTATLQPFLTLASFETPTFVKAALNPAGDRAVVSLAHKTAMVVHLPDGEILARWTDSPGQILSVTFCRDGQAVAALGSDTSVYLWDSATGESLLKFTAHMELVTALAAVNKSELLVSGDRAGRILLWNGLSGTVVRELRTGGPAVGAIASSADGRWVAVSFSEGSTMLYALDAPESPLALSASALPMTSLVFGQDGKRLAGLSKYGQTDLWDVESGQEVLALGSTNRPMAAGIQVDAVHDRIIVGSGPDALQLIPAFPRALYEQESISPQSLENYKRSRGEAAPEFILDPTEIRAHTPAVVAEEAIARLDLEAEQATSAPYTEPVHNPLARLGLLPGDTVTKLNDFPCEGIEKLSAMLQEFAQAENDASLRVIIARNGAERSIDLRKIPLVERTRTVEFSRERAGELLQGTRQFLLNLQTFILDYNRRMSKAAGAKLTNPEAIDGYWVLPSSTLEDDRALMELGLSDSDCILEVNGLRITSLQQLDGLIGRAIDAMIGGASGSVQLTVRRDRFQVLNLIWAIM